MSSLLIKNGKIIDGTGNPWFYGDIAISSGKIVEVGKGLAFAADKVIDANHNYVTPGFIDVHTHSDFTILKCPTADSKIHQGITTEVGGNCGFSLAPVNPTYLEATKKFVSFMPSELDWNWTTITELLSLIKEQGSAVNFGTLVGQGLLRIAAMGFDNRVPTEQEMETMKTMLADALDQGAVGLSMGLVYAPGSYASKEEIIELAKIAAKKNKVLTAHVRNEGEEVVESVKEVIEIASRAQVSLQISHLKATGKDNWAKKDLLIELVEEARSKGLDVTFDVYPYNALNTLLTALLPGWAQEGGIEKILTRIAEKESRERLLVELEHESVKYGGWDNIMVASVKYPKNRWVEGKTFAEIAKAESKSPQESMLDLLYEDECSIMVVCFSMSEENIEKALKHPLSMLGSDGKILTTTGELGEGRPHPRNFGAFPRFLTKYVRENQIMSLEEGIRKMTSAPAQKYHIQERGILKPGYKADVLVFDLDKLQDNPTFENPKCYATGFDFIIVNGEVTIEKDKHLGVTNGELI